MYQYPSAIIGRTHTQFIGNAFGYTSDFSFIRIPLCPIPIGPLVKIFKILRFYTSYEQILLKSSCSQNINIAIRIWCTCAFCIYNDTTSKGRHPNIWCIRELKGCFYLSNSFFKGYWRVFGNSQ